MILLDSGTTTLEVARHLPPDLEATVITNSPPIAAALAEHPKVEVAVVGGMLAKHAQALVGAATVDALRSVRADVLVLGVCSVHPEIGITVLELEESYVKQAMIANSAEVVAVSSAAKLGSAGPYVVAPLDELTYLVTEEPAPAEQLDAVPRRRRRGRARVMRGTRVALTLFFLADGLLIGSWASRIPAVQRQTDLTNSQLGVALFAMSLGALVSMPLAGWLGERIGSRIVTTAALIGGSASLFLASLAGGLGGLAAALLGVRRRLRRDERCRERAGDRARAAVRALDPLVVPRGVQRRRPGRRRPRRARRRGRESGRARTSRCSRSRSSPAPSSALAGCSRRSAASGRPGRCSPARRGPCSSSAWRRSSRCWPREPPPTGAPSTSPTRSAPRRRSPRSATPASRSPWPPAGWPATA